MDIIKLFFGSLSLFSSYIIFNCPCEILIKCYKIQYSIIIILLSLPIFFDFPLSPSN